MTRQVVPTNGSTVLSLSLSNSLYVFNIFQESTFQDHRVRTYKIHLQHFFNIGKIAQSRVKKVHFRTFRDFSGKSSYVFVGMNIHELQ